MVYTPRDHQSDIGGRFLPAIVILAALIVLAGLFSVRAEQPADPFDPSFLEAE